MNVVSEAHQGDECGRQAAEVNGALCRHHGHVQAAAPGRDGHHESCHDIEEGEDIVPVDTGSY